MNLNKIKQTKSSVSTGIMRILLGVIFIMTGVMKISLEEFGNAWSIQLIEAGIPFYTFNLWFVPFFEIFLGIILLLGFYSRVGALMILPVMFVAIYVHLTVSNPAAFPAQPQDPYIPIIIIVMALIVLKKGGGNWSKDLKVSS